jgi:hypothetical protein
MTDTAPISTKLTLALRFVKNFYIEFNENQANRIVADTRSWTDVITKKKKAFLFAAS